MLEIKLPQDLYNALVNISQGGVGIESAADLIEITKNHLASKKDAKMIYPIPMPPKINEALLGGDITQDQYDKLCANAQDFLRSQFELIPKFECPCCGKKQSAT